MRMKSPGILEKFDLSGRHALITGSVRGLGFEIARGLGQAGASVMVNGRDLASVGAQVAVLRASGLDAEPLTLDVTDETAVNAWFAGYGKNIDILVNNVGMRDRRATQELTPDDFARVLDVGITSAYRMTRLIVPAMAGRGKGVVVNVASVAGPLARPGDPGYTVAKAGIDALTRSHAVELAMAGIRVNAVAPGFFATEANSAWVGDPAVTDFIERRVPMQRWGQAGEIAGAVVFLASDAASFVTGHTLVVDAGLSVRM